MLFTQIPFVLFNDKTGSGVMHRGCSFTRRSWEFLFIEFQQRRVSWKMFIFLFL